MNMKWKLPWRPKRKGPEKEADYHPDRYLPGLQARARRRRRRWFLLFAAAGASAVLVLLFAFLVRAPFFRVREVEIRGNEEASREEVLAFLESEVLKGGGWRAYLGFSHLLVWPDSISVEDLAVLPVLKRVEISKNWWNKKVSITVEERKVFGIWCRDTEDTRCFWFDEDGTLLRPSPQVSGSLILMVRDASGAELSAGSRMLPQAEIPNAFSVFRVLQESGAGVQEIRVEDRNLAEMKVRLENGPALYFSLRFPADNALAVLQSLGSKSSEFAGIQYIDFRVENRAYYK